MPEDSSRSPRAARTRSALLSAGLDLLAERPVDAIAIDELVAAAGVAKGSFFNHFGDKYAFADAVSAEIRVAIERRVAAANQGIEDPLERLTGGMIVAAAFALSEPRRTVVVTRTGSGMLLTDHPLNRGVLHDIQDCVKATLVRPEAARAGVLFWLGCCQALMGAIVAQKAPVEEAADLLTDMLVIGLGGLGADPARAAALVEPKALRRKLRTAIEAPREDESSASKSTR